MQPVTDVLFQAEDGIRGYKVTGVQTCALPIYALVGMINPSTVAAARRLTRLSAAAARTRVNWPTGPEMRRLAVAAGFRSEERRVGKECATGQRAGQEDEASSQTPGQKPTCIES